MKFNTNIEFLLQQRFNFENFLTTCPNILAHNILFPLTGRESRNEISTTRDSQDSQMVRVPGRKSRRMPCIPLVEYREILPRKWTANTMLENYRPHRCIDPRVKVHIEKGQRTGRCLRHLLALSSSKDKLRVLATQSCPRVFSPSSLSLS